MFFLLITNLRKKNTRGAEITKLHKKNSGKTVSTQM